MTAVLTTATHTVQLLHLPASPQLWMCFCCHNHFTDIHSYLHFETELSRTYKTCSGSTAVVAEFYSIWSVRKLSDTRLYNHLSLVPTERLRLTSSAAAAAAIATLQRQPQYRGSISRLSQFQILANKSKSLLWQHAGAAIPNSPLPLTFRERKKTARSSPKFVCRQIFYPGCWRSILTPKCRRRFYRARNGKDNKWPHIMLKCGVIENVMSFTNK